MKFSRRFVISIQLCTISFFIFGFICAGGCTAPGSSIEVQQTPAASLFKYKIISVEVTTKDLDFDEMEIDQLTGSILSGLRKSARFDKVYAASFSDENDADLKLSVVIRFVEAVNYKSAQSIESSMVLVDSGNGETLARAFVNSDSGRGLFGGKMTNAIVTLSNQIVDFVTKP